MEMHCCKVCLYKTDRISNLVRHRIKVHKVKKPSAFKCTLCSKNFDKFKIFQRHTKQNKCLNINSEVNQTSLVPSQDSEKLEQNNILPKNCNFVSINNDSVEQTTDITGSVENVCIAIKKEAEPLKAPVKKESCEIYSSEKYETILLWNKQLIPEIKLERLRTDDDVKIFARWLLRNEIKPFTAEISNSSPSEIKNDLFDCNFCDRRFAFRRYLSIHVKNVHKNSIKRPVRFSSRPRNSGKNENFTERKTEEPSATVTTMPVTTIKEVEQRCSECKTLCSSVEALNSHMKRHKVKIVAPDDKKKSKDIKIQVQENFEKQLSIHQTDVRKRQRKRVGKSSISKEVKETQKKPKNKDSIMATPLTSTLKIFECDICDYVTRYGFRLTSHKKVHFKSKQTKQWQSKKSAWCQFCDYKTLDNYRLKSHLWRKHKDQNLNLKIYKCELCDYCTATNDHLRKHTMRKHKLILGYSCNKCNEMFPSKYDMKCHQWKQIKENKSCVPISTDLTKSENLNT